jgi:flagellar protein FliS
LIQSPYQKYQQAQAQTASKPKLLIMLYDGAIRFTRAGADGILDKDFGKANYNLCKSQAIIHELISALNFDYPIAQDLLRIYEYMLHCLIESNIHKDVSKAREVEEHLTELREAWVEVSKLPSSVTGN